MDIKKWGSDNIIWKGNEDTNYSGRHGKIPDIIVNHMSQGTASSVIDYTDWFTSPNNKVSSAHFLVTLDGKVCQFVSLINMAWANGLALDKIENALSPLIRSRAQNPNLYTVSIEHEGYYSKGKGKLTAAQLESTILLHKYIIYRVDEMYGFKMQVDREHILGHNEIDPIRKPYCPGENFQFKEILEGINGLPFNDIKDHSLKESIIKAFELKLIDGYPDGSYRPSRYMTRAEAADLAVSIYKRLKEE